MYTICDLGDEREDAGADFARVGGAIGGTAGAGDPVAGGGGGASDEDGCAADADLSDGAGCGVSLEASGVGGDWGGELG